MDLSPKKGKLFIKDLSGYFYHKKIRPFNWISLRQFLMNIITLTFSPCIDKTTSVPDLIPEKKLGCRQPVLEPGGGGINVSRAISKLGGTSTAIYPSGGCTGLLFDRLLARDQIPCIIIRSENETRENFIVVEESSGNQYRFGIPGTFFI